ncbi:hypothetical protein D3C80_1588130 [compost metagenome]
MHRIVFNAVFGFLKFEVSCFRQVLGTLQLALQNNVVSYVPIGTDHPDVARIVNERDGSGADVTQSPIRHDDAVLIGKSRQPCDMEFDVFL